MNNYHSIENFENDCTTPCLIGDINPYDFTKALYHAGKNHRIRYSVDPIMMEDLDKMVNIPTNIESFVSKSSITEGFYGGYVKKHELIQTLKKRLTPYEIEECFLDTYLNSNFFLKFANEKDVETRYQIDMKIVKVPDSKNYRIVCRPHGKENRNIDGHFLTVLNNNGKNELYISDEGAYILETRAKPTTNKADEAATLYNEYNGTGMEVEEFTNEEKNEVGILRLNPNNRLLFRFWKTYDQKVLINVFDTGTLAKGSVSGEPPKNYGYLCYGEGFSLNFLQRTDVFPVNSVNNEVIEVNEASNVNETGVNNVDEINDAEENNVDEVNEAGANIRLVNLNYDLLVPHKIDNRNLDKFLETNIKFPHPNKSEFISGTIKILPYYIDDDNLFYVYRNIISLPDITRKQYGFIMDSNGRNIILEERCTGANTTKENVLFTFWQTLDKQFTVTKILSNTITNCEYVDTNNGNDIRKLVYRRALQDVNYYLIGMGDDLQMKLYGLFSDSLHFAINTINLKVYPVQKYISMIKKIAIGQVSVIAEKEMERIRNSMPHLIEPSGSDNNAVENDECNNKNVNFMIFLKIISMCLALFLFIDLDYSEILVVKLFKGFFAMLFSEIYLIYQFMRIVIYGD
jgi:hypothetical protein